MNAHNKKLFIALVIGVLAVGANALFIRKVQRDASPQKIVQVVSVGKRVLAGAPIGRKDLKKAKVPKNFSPKSAIPWGDRDAYIGQEVAVDIPAGDYLLQSYFGSRISVGNRLSQQVGEENMRAISLPVNETNSLSRSIIVGDSIDIIFTFSVPVTGQKMSTLLLQNVPVISTGTYSAAEQEIGTRGGRAKKYSSLTVKLPAEDAVRLNYARQVGKISLMLRHEKDSGVLDVPPITNVSDLLSAADKAKIGQLLEQSGVSLDQRNKIRKQMEQILEKQRQQVQRNK